MQTVCDNKKPQPQYSKTIRFWIGLRTFSFLVFAMGILIGLRLQLSASQNSTAEEIGAETTSDVKTPNTSHLSVASCTSCHASHALIDSENPADRWQIANLIWANQDPHSQAYYTLRNEQSKKIISTLAKSLIAKQPASEKTPSEKQQHQTIVNERCIACHSTVPPEMATANDLLTANGVSCISCHSNADPADANAHTWIELHKKQEWATGKYVKSENGLRDLSNHSIRAASCTKCHVGSKAGDVNHDLIAAGHPRLVFEYSSHLSRLPKHWDEVQNKNFHVESWAIGQFETTKASVALLANRAYSSQFGDTPWPEFAEYKCEDCHHNLAGNWRQPKDAKTQIGKPDWNTLGFSASFVEPSASRIEKLRQEMQEFNPDAAVIAAMTCQLAIDAPDIPATDYMDAFLEHNPGLTSDEVYEWYLAAHSYFRDMTGDAAIKAGLNKKLLRLWEIMNASHDGKHQMQSQQELLQLMSEVKEIVQMNLGPKRGERHPTP